MSYFFFKDLTAEDVYEVRRTMEPALASHITKTADQALIDRLTENVEASQGSVVTREDWKRHQQLHIQFHEILAGGAKNSMLCLHCSLMNRTIRSIVRSRESPNQADLIRSNTVWHEKILDAIVARDADKAEQFMREHIIEIENNYKITGFALKNELHLETLPPHQLSAFKELP